VSPDPRLFAAIQRLGPSPSSPPHPSHHVDHHTFATDDHETPSNEPTSSATTSSGESEVDLHALNRLITALGGDVHSLLDFAHLHLRSLGPINMATLLNRYGEMKMHKDRWKYISKVW
jgi:hypothetical protein